MPPAVNEKLGTGVVPPNNQGVATPLYNVGQQWRRPGQRRCLDHRSTRPLHGSEHLRDDPTATWLFAGQRDDGFYADIQGVCSILLSFHRAQQAL